MSERLAQEACLMIFAKREGGRLWQTLYADKLTFGRVKEELLHGSAVARALEACRAGSGTLRLRVANPGSRWNPRDEGGVEDRFFTQGAVSIVHPITFVDDLRRMPSMLAMRGCDLRVVENARCQA